MPAKPRMDDASFWRVLSLLDWNETGDDDAVLRPAREALAALPAEDIFRFDDLLAEKLHALDTREHCRACYRGESDPDDGDAYVSADGFLYARCVVVANGRDFYADVLRDPAKFPQGMEFEALLSLASEAYGEKTGEEYEHVSPVSYESFTNADGWRPTAATRGGTFTGANVPPLNRRPA